MNEFVAQEKYFLQHEQWISKCRSEPFNESAYLGKAGRKDGANLVRSGLTTTVGSVEPCEHTNQQLKNLQ